MKKTYIHPYIEIQVVTVDCQTYSGSNADSNLPCDSKKRETVNFADDNFEF